MNLKSTLIVALALLAASSEAGFAADPRYPDWPCEQAKVPEISLAAVWAGPPLADAQEKWKNDPKVSTLVAKLSLRRVPLEAAETAAKDFLAGSASDKSENAKLLFAGLFETLNAQRSSVLNGLERVSHKQRDAAEKIRDDTLELQTLQDATPRDEARVDALSNQLVWETRIFEDRRKMLHFVCEVPTMIDQRLFALGRVIQQEMD